MPLKVDKVLPPKPYYKAVIEPDGWIPIPDAALAEARLREGDHVELFVTHNQIIIRRKGFSTDKAADDVTNTNPSTTPQGPPEG